MYGFGDRLTRQARAWVSFVRLRQLRSGTLGRLSCLLRGGALLFVLGTTLTISLNREKLAGLAGLGYLGAFLVMLLSNATLILPAPGLIFVFSLGANFNPLAVGACAASGATLGELTGYLTGYSGLGVSEDTPFAHRVQRWMERSGTLTIFILSIIPNPLFDLAGILAGTGRMPVWRFLGISFGGKLIQSTAIALAGAASVGWVRDWLAH